MGDRRVDIKRRDLRADIRDPDRRLLLTAYGHFQRCIRERDQGHHSPGDDYAMAAKRSMGGLTKIKCRLGVDSDHADVALGGSKARVDRGGTLRGSNGGASLED